MKDKMEKKKKNAVNVLKKIIRINLLSVVLIVEFFFRKDI